MLQTVSLLGVNVSRVTLPKAVGQILAWVKDRKHTYVCVAPVSTLVEARRDPDYREAVNAAGMVTPDGMPVVWLAHWRGCPEVNRTYGPDLMQEVCKQGQAKGIRHFFYGGTTETLRKLEAKFIEMYPDVNFVGSIAPPFMPQVQQERKDIIDAINKSQADIVWVGLGSPKQDFWMQLHRPLLNCPVIVGAGAAFDFLSGTKPQAPRWMQTSGLEWVFRLCCEPRRLWKRYLIGNSLFLFYLVKDSLKKSANL